MIGKTELFKKNYIERAAGKKVSAARFRFSLDLLRIKIRAAFLRCFHDCSKYTILIIAILFGIYLLCFALLESLDPPNVLLIDLQIDHIIPFSKYAAVFYCLWHAEIPIIMLYAYFKKSKKEYWELALSLLIGMFLILFICTVFPNQVALRPEYVEGNDLFACLTRLVYSLDDSQNVFPSGHALGAVLMAIGWYRFMDKTWKKTIGISSNALIILSTLLLKQHSIIDVLAGIILAFIVNQIIPSIYALFGDECNQ